MLGPTHPSAISGVFGSPFTEQVAFFRQKLGNLVPTERWDDLLAAEHDRAFMVAGATKAELLSDLAAAVDKAIAEGRGIEDFRKDFREIVARNGWTGWTGEGSVKGEAWRVRTIYRTNSYTSYAAGRYAQLKAEGFPFWVYRHGGSLEPRPQHLSWDGLVLPADHPFWATHYPPSDWGCSCYVLGASSEAGARRMGGDPARKLPANWQAIDPKTGAPVGIGKGWNYAPGASVASTVAALAEKITKWEHRIATAFMETLPTAQADAISDAYRALPSTADASRRYAQRVFNGTDGGTADMAPLPEVRTLGMLPSRLVGEVNDLLGSDKVTSPAFDLSLTRQFVQHIRRQHGPGSKDQMPIGPDDFTVLGQLISAPDALRAGERSALPAVVFAKAVNGRMYEAVFELRAGNRSLALKSLYIRRKVK